jgi:Tfp pilus assembly protein PilP
MKKNFFILGLIMVMSIIIIGCAKKEEKKVVILPPKIPIAKPEMYVPERYEYKSFRKRDPFVPLVVSEKKPAAGVEAQDLSQINIADLELSGIIWDEKESMAILHDGNNFGYILKGGRLLADNFKPIKGIRGKIIGNKRIFLQQGKTNVDFFIGKPKITRIKGAQMLAQKEIER